jgi:chromate transporter
VILAAALVGVAGARLAPKAFTAPSHDAKGGAPRGAVIDDDTATPPHAVFSRAKLLAKAAIFLALWAGALAGLAALFGWEADLTQMGWFFTKAALLTFGRRLRGAPLCRAGRGRTHGWALPRR